MEINMSIETIVPLINGIVTFVIGISLIIMML
jgi:hypothetical protein